MVTTDFKMVFLNEVYHVIKQFDMSMIRLVNFVDFFDKESKLITGGIDGIFLFDVKYEGKYEPQQAAQID